MGDGMRRDNYVGQSRFISSIHLYEPHKFKQMPAKKNVKVFKIKSGFLQAIDVLVEKSYIKKYSIDRAAESDAVLYLPGWSAKPTLVSYIAKNFNGVKYIKQHPADNDVISSELGFTPIDSCYMAEQVICELMSKFKRITVVLESEASGYSFRKVECIYFYLAHISKNNKTCIKRIFF